MDRILRKPEVERITGVNRTTIWRWVKAGHFPPPKRLSPTGTGAMGWLESDVLEWLEKVKKAG